MRIFRLAGPLAIVLDHDVGDGQRASCLFDETEIRSDSRTSSLHRMDHLRKGEKVKGEINICIETLIALRSKGKEEKVVKVEGFLFGVFN